MTGEIFLGKHVKYSVDDDSPCFTDHYLIDMSYYGLFEIM